MKCEDCKYWDEQTKDPEAKEHYGFCKRYAPRVNENKENWAYTDNIDWCGEFKPKEKAKDAAVSLAGFHFSCRIRNILEQMKIDSTEKLTNLTVQDLMYERGCGITSIALIEEKLASVGLKLKDEH